jgi:hypothetical protein
LSRDSRLWAAPTVGVEEAPDVEALDIEGRAKVFVLWLGMLVLGWDSDGR